jgi:hypothetical protein
VRVPVDDLFGGRLETLDGCGRGDGEIALGCRHEVVEAIGEDYVRVAASVGADGVGEGIGEWEENDRRDEELKEMHFGGVDGVRAPETRGGVLSHEGNLSYFPTLGLGNLRRQVTCRRL